MTATVYILLYHECDTYRLQSSNRGVGKMDRLMTKNDNSFERLKDMQEKKVGLGWGSNNRRGVSISSAGGIKPTLL